MRDKPLGPKQFCDGSITLTAGWRDAIPRMLSFTSASSLIHSSADIPDGMPTPNIAAAARRFLGSID